MDRRLKISLQWVLCFVVVVVFAWHGSKASMLHFPKGVLRPSKVLPFTRRLLLKSISVSSAARVDTRSQGHDLSPPSMISPSPDSGKEISGDDASRKTPDKSPTTPTQPEGPAHSPAQATHPDINSTQHGVPVAAPPIETSTPSSPMNSKGFVPATPPTSNSQPSATATPPTSNAEPPIIFHSPAPSVTTKPPQTASPPSSTKIPGEGIPEAPTPADVNISITHAPAPLTSHSPAPDIAVKPPKAAAPPTSNARPPVILHSLAPGKSTEPPKTASPPTSNRAPGEGISEAPAPVESNISTAHAPDPLTLHSPAPNKVVMPPIQAAGPISQSQPPAASQGLAPDQAKPPSTSQVSHSPAPEESRRPNSNASSPMSHSEPPQGNISDPPVPPTIISTPEHKLPRTSLSPISPPSPSPRTSNTAAPIAPTQHRSNQKRMGGHTSAPASPAPTSAHDPEMEFSPAPSHPPEVPNNSQRHAFPPHIQGPVHSPVHPPSGSLSRNAGTPRPQPIRALPPPPPNLDCSSLVCAAPLTNPPPAVPCACVQPMKVGLRLGIELYTFFPLVSELAQEVASGVVMEQSQVRIMGANAASEDPEKTIVLLDLVPLGYIFDNTTAFTAYEKFWNKQVQIKASYFGDYDVLYVIYPGLPPSPPSAPADVSGDGAFNNGNNGRTIKPIGVDVERKKREKLNGSLIAIIVLSSVVALVLVVGAHWLILSWNRSQNNSLSQTPQTLLPSLAKSSATGPTTLGSHSSASASFSSSIATYALKTFSLSDIEIATSRFHNSRVIGEGGFGRVYEGTLEDGTRVAVKVLKRDDQQGGREFLAEVEMLSRLHHRNLVKLIGICTEEIRCLVYELIPNGSVESHLHGIDKAAAPLDWNVRMKIALGAARGLAYLHEDSSPRVIHRDFKSSNILLEFDYTPKVSDFGLARTALEEGNEHISTRVMGTFGYVAPEYAMTGHLLVKSDVYSYGVVLLELLTGRKPVDMLQPPGQENLVNWARPLLTSKEGLQTIIDPALGTKYPFGDVAKVAAIASMCVQPEVSHRPFMGEVVQALKLVCNEEDENKGSGSCSQDYSSAQDTTDIRTSAGYGLESERMLSASDVFSTSTRFTKEASSSFRRFASSGPLTTSRGQQNWQRTRGLSTGSMSDHDLVLKLGSGIDGNEEWL